MVLVSWRLLLVPDWGHLPWRPYWQAISPKPLDFGGPSVVFLSGAPVSFVAASLPADARYVGLRWDFDLRADHDSPLVRQLKRELASTPDLRLKEGADGTVPGFSAAVLASYGLLVTERCEPLNVGGRAFRVCDVAHRS
jgi:hypothetical protein